MDIQRGRGGGNFKPKYTGKGGGQTSVRCLEGKRDIFYFLQAVWIFSGRAILFNKLIGNVFIHIDTQNIQIMFSVGRWVRTVILWQFCHGKMNIFDSYVQILLPRLQ